MTIDLRSDTVTRPSPGMREVIARADVGDDVLGDDPTVNILQKKVAAMLGKETGLFVPSGTMGNEVAVKAHTQPGDEVIIESTSHIVKYEAGGTALLSGVQLRTLDGQYGVLSAEQIKAAINPDNVHIPPTTLICLENTHNYAGGTLFPLEEIINIREMANRHRIKMHLDGARLWNASIASDIPLKEYARYFDSISVCFSKGLGAPVGSMLVGETEWITIAHRYRKIFGGGMRQAGILAAAALYAIEHNIERLAEDHNNARILAEAVNPMPGISIDLDSVQTNIVYMHVENSSHTASDIVQLLKEKNILIMALGPARLRAVTHLEISEEDILRTIQAFEDILK